MLDWWNSLPVLAQIFFFIALPSTAVLAIQTVLLFFGGGASDAELPSDVSGMGHDAPDTVSDAHDFDADGLRLFSVRGIIAFLTVGGWTGALCALYGLPDALSITLATIAGFAALLAMAYMIKALMKLQESGTLDYSEALGKNAKVYLAIPDSGTGKINVEVNGSLGEFLAVSEDGAHIPTGAQVKVTDLRGDTYVVSKV